MCAVFLNCAWVLFWIKVMQLALECELPKGHGLFINTALNSDLSINMSVFIENRARNVAQWYSVCLEHMRT